MSAFRIITVCISFSVFAAIDPNDIPISYVEAATLFMQRLLPNLNTENQQSVLLFLDALQNETRYLDSEIQRQLKNIEIQAIDQLTGAFLKGQIVSISSQFSKKWDSQLSYWEIEPQGLERSSIPLAKDFRLIPTSSEKQNLLAKRSSRK